MSTDRIKIQFRLNPEDGHGFDTDGLWADPMGSGEFRILNSPFFVFGISAEDIVRATAEAGLYQFQQVVRRGGHSTYRLFLQGGNTIKDIKFRDLWKRLEQLGCTFENANDRFVAVDVPPTSDIHAAYKQFEAGERDGIWVFEEGHCELAAPK